ncbi:MAG TPA: hypothetical protein VJB11_04145 [archaeon]|nr:hypothetical protein [archaeon]
MGYVPKPKEKKCGSAEFTGCKEYKKLKTGKNKNNTEPYVIEPIKEY